MLSPWKTEHGRLILIYFSYFRLSRGKAESSLPPGGINFEVKFETDLKKAFRILQVALQIYKDERRGPTIVAVQSLISEFNLRGIILCRLNRSITDIT
jgi:hypothetical protein